VALYLLCVIGILLWMTGCASKPVEQSAICPSVKTFSRAWQRELAQDLGPIPANSPIMDMVADWERMRAELRACQD
jgi:hypothetical protein